MLYVLAQQHESHHGKGDQIELYLVQIKSILAIAMMIMMENMMMVMMLLLIIESVIHVSEVER